MQFEKREMKMRRAGKAGRAAVFCLCAGLVLGDPVKGFAWEQTEYVRRATGSNALGRPLLMAESKRSVGKLGRRPGIPGWDQRGRKPGKAVPDLHKGTAHGPFQACGHGNGDQRGGGNVSGRLFRVLL